MGKLTTYMPILGGIILLFYISGIADFTPAILELLKNPQNLNTSDFVVLVLSAAGLTAAIWVGFVTKDTAFAIKSALIVFIFNLLFGGFIDIFNLIETKVNWAIAALLFSPLMILLVVTIIEWLTGTDNG